MPAVSGRAHLLAAVAACVHAARHLDGSAGIALLGSLATEQPDPQDADLPVAVADDPDLTGPASLASASVAACPPGWNWSTGSRSPGSSAVGSCPAARRAAANAGMRSPRA
jgi:hypothetical protein